jgi:hypothetical protein
MQLGGLAGLTALTMGIDQDKGASAPTLPRAPVHTNGQTTPDQAIATLAPAPAASPTSR